MSQVQRAFNGLGQMTVEYQAISGSVNTSTTPKVQYAYTEMAGGANHSRQTSVTYPNGRIVRTEYTSGLDDSISRPSFLADDNAGSVGTHLEEYSYLGLSTIVARNHPEPGLNLTYVSQTGSTGDAGDQYVGLDRFGRVVDQRWVNVAGLGGTTNRDAERFQYTYDQNSNVATKQHTSYANTGGFDEAYTYDGLNRLTKLSRGTLVSGSITSPTFSQAWDGVVSGTGLDALGNWKGVSVNGGTATTHTFNSQNQITAVSGATSPTYDADGNMTQDETGDKYVYDAWNRTVKVNTSTGTNKVTYTVNPLGRRAQQTVNAGVGATTRYYFSNNWQVLEEDQLSGTSWVPAYQTVFSLAYIDGVVERDTLDSTSAGALDTSFATSGKYVKSLGTGISAIRFVQQLNGKLIGAGVVGSHIGMVRLNSNGTLDTTFKGPAGTGAGYFTVSIGTTDTALAVAVQDDGKIVIVGTSDSKILVGRFNTDGSWDTTFKGPAGTGSGYFTLSFTSALGQGVTLQPDGKIVLCGNVSTDMLVARLTTTGAYDTSFHTTGYYQLDWGGTDRAVRVAVDHNGSIVVAGDTTIGSTGGDVAIARFTSSGSLDTTFNTTGKITTSLSSSQDTPWGLAIDDQNRILIAAHGDGNLDAIRYTAAGVLDSTFGTGGIVSVDVNGVDQAESIAEDPFGRILLAGSSNGQKDFAIARLTSAGTLDTTFNTTGKQTVSFSSNNAASEIAYTMLVQPTDGRIVLAGLSDVSVAVARLSGGGTRNYQVQDANWDVTAATDATGTVIDRYVYDAYGQTTTLNPDFSVNLSGYGNVYSAYYFQGLRYDGNSGNYNARNRDLRSSLGAWTQQDPAGYIDGKNLYQFVESNSLTHLDPLGLDSNPQRASTTRPSTGPTDPNPEIPKLLNDLNSSNWRTREAAQKELQKLMLANRDAFRGINQNDLTPQQKLALDCIKNNMPEAIKERGDKERAAIKKQMDAESAVYGISSDRFSSAYGDAVAKYGSDATKWPPSITSALQDLGNKRDVDYQYLQYIEAQLQREYDAIP